MGLGLALAVVFALGGRSHADSFSSGVFVRADTDDTTVIAPRIGADMDLDDDGRTRMNLAYAADIWTSASIDIRTAATKAITEQRDELTGGISHDLTDLTIGASGYYSHENDYTATGASVYAIQRLGEGSASLEERLKLGYDIAGRSGDADFARPLGTLGGRFVFSQYLSADSILQLAYETSYREGYQANPYRFVGMGGDGRCQGTATLCLPEVHPDTRFRHAFVVQARHSLSDDASFGYGYRFYIDSWGVDSHTGMAQLAWWVGDESTITLRYRFNFQGEADFYRAQYPVPVGELRFITRDRELSPLFSNRAALSYEATLDLDDWGTALRIALAFGGTVFAYRDFVGLDEVVAADATLALTLEL